MAIMHTMAQVSLVAIWWVRTSSNCEALSQIGNKTPSTFHVLPELTVHPLFVEVWYSRPVWSGEGSLLMKTLGVGTSRDKWYSSVVNTCQWVTEPGPVKAGYMGTCTDVCFKRMSPWFSGAVMKVTSGLPGR